MGRHSLLERWVVASQLPNILTLLRFLLIPALVMLLWEELFAWSIVVFMVAGGTDALDGFLAKRYRGVTSLGTLLDPLADKALLISVMVVLQAKGVLPLWFLGSVIGCDLLILAGIGGLWLRKAPVVIAPSFLGKVTTALQMFLVLVLLVCLVFFPSFLEYMRVFFVGVALFSIVSVAHYGYGVLSRYFFVSRS